MKTRSVLTTLVLSSTMLLPVACLPNTGAQAATSRGCHSNPVEKAETWARNVKVHAGVLAAPETWTVYQHWRIVATSHYIFCPRYYGTPGDPPKMKPSWFHYCAWKLDDHFSALTGFTFDPYISNFRAGIINPPSIRIDWEDGKGKQGDHRCKTLWLGDDATRWMFVKSNVFWRVQVKGKMWNGAGWPDSSWYLIWDQKIYRPYDEFHDTITKHYPKQVTP